MRRRLTTAQLAHALGGSEQTVRYHARHGAMPFSVTPGGHRRYDLDEVRVALERRGHGVHSGRVRLDGDFPSFGARLDLSDPRARPLTESAEIELRATAGYDERRFDQVAERLPGDFMTVFAVPGSARYARTDAAVTTQ